MNSLIVYAFLASSTIINVINVVTAAVGPSVSTTIECSCIAYGRIPVCCHLVDNSTYNPRADGIDRLRGLHRHKDRYHNLPHCVENRTYYPSLYEEMNFNLSINIQKMPTAKGRYDALKSFYESLKNYQVAEIWLKRIKERMLATNDEIIENEVDWKYLSRFQVELQCGSRTYSWNEWIEPLTVHCRHPNFLRHRASKLMSADYILLKSHASHYNNSLNMKPGQATKHFLLDAGSSTFESSLLWFTCGYKQVNYTHMYFA